MTRLSTRSLALVATATLALALVACDSDVRISKKETSESANSALKAIARLDCPEAQGELIRRSVDADSKICVYAAKDGETDVTLRLVALTAGEDAALAPIETELRGVVPPPPAGKGAEISADAGADAAHIRIPGLSIDADGDKAEVNIGGIHINAQGDNAQISVKQRKGDVNIVANDGGAEIRAAKSDDLSIRRTLILASDNPSPSGYRVAGYEARGPKAGPLVVALVQAKKAKGEGDVDYVFRDMKALVTHNVGK